MNYAVEHFKAEEFLCPCCKEGAIARVLVLWLDQLRRAWGAPVIVNSGWRCASRNAEVGGSKGSRHLIGCAADIRNDNSLVSGGRGDYADFMALARRVGNLPGWEVRVYNGFMHVAAPREEAMRTWNGEEIEIYGRAD